MQEEKISTKQIIEGIAVFIITILVLALMLEGMLVFKNRDGKNYDIEMWKYSRSLKRVSANPKLGHEHIPNKSAKLQNVDIKINSLGMRGAEPSTDASKTIIFLGSSIALGWGVLEEEIYPSLLQKELQTAHPEQKIQIYNAGVGNYNTQREVDAFFANQAEKIKPDIIVLNYFIRDAEIIPAPKSNWLLENSQLAVTIWSRIEQFKRKFGVEKSFEQHYKDIYADDYAGWLEAQKSFTKLADYAKANNVRVIVLMIPDIHNLTNYPFDFIHDKVKALAQANGFEFVDSLASFKQIAKQEDLWAMPGDPHPNALGHRILADSLKGLL